MSRIAFLILVLSLLNADTADAQQLRQVDERRAAQVGIRRVDGRHLRLYTDLPQHDAIDGLGNVFDAAVPHWAKYFGIPAERVANWRVQAFLIEDRTKFAALGLLPEANRNFAHGYCQGGEVWLIEQASDYYRRHLLLHEGTHAFMYAFLGDKAPGWYMEGMAELLGTHRWHKGELTLRHFPASREQAPLWGRIKLIREAKPLSLQSVVSFRTGRALSIDQYAWCWALCKFFDTHPQQSERFRQALQYAKAPDFNNRFNKPFQKDWPELEREWQAFLAELDYGYDCERMSIVHEKQPRPHEQAVRISAERGWQSTGWRLRPGHSYKVRAEGRFQIAEDTEPWPSEPDGVTIEYHGGQPLGKLLGVLWPIDPAASIDFTKPIAIGSHTSLDCQEDAILYLRVNDSPAKLSDNLGTVSVSISPAAKTRDAKTYDAKTRGD